MHFRMGFEANVKDERRVFTFEKTLKNKLTLDNRKGFFTPKKALEGVKADLIWRVFRRKLYNYTAVWLLFEVFSNFSRL